MIRRAAPDDFAALAALHARSFPDDGWSAEDMRKMSAQTWVITESAKPIGFVMLSLAAGEAEVLTIAIDPDAQGKGHGRALLQHALDDLRTEGLVEVFLEVAVDNTAALALYRAAGFVEVGVRRGYYDRPGGDVDALVFRRGF